MKATLLTSFLGLVLVLGLLGAAPLPQQEKPLDFDPTIFAQINGSQIIFTGKVSGIGRVAVATSKPPIYYTTLMFHELELLRGKPTHTANQKGGGLNKPIVVRYRPMQLTHIVRQNVAPEFPRETTWLVAADEGTIRYMVPVSDKLLALARKAAALPIGWTLEKGQPVSPWVPLGGKDYRFERKHKEVRCAKCGRPALLVGEGIEVQSEQVLPAGRDERKNPYGDGQFRITVTNTTDQPVEVNALLSDGKTICWEDSLLVQFGSETYLLPGAGKFKEARPTQLQPKESVSTVVDVLPLEGPLWTRVGSRMYLQFCLGEKATTNFFYYNPDHHDKLREASRKKIPEKEKP